MLSGKAGYSERQMFGGIAFMINGNMACGITRDDLMVRVRTDTFQDCLSQPHARPMDFTGRPMAGMVFVGPPAYDTAAGLATWVGRGAEYAASLPAK